MLSEVNSIDKEDHKPCFGRTYFLRKTEMEVCDNAGAQKRNLSKGMVGSRSKWKDDIRSLMQHMDELLNDRAYIWRPKSESLKFAEF